MATVRFRCLWVMALLALAVPASAQKIQQKWAAPNGAVGSRVQTCTAPLPTPLIAADDWICPQSGSITWVRWWGVVSSNAQRFRQYHIAVWSHNTATCRPNAVLQFWCVTPTSVRVGTDCNNRKVFKFEAALAPAFVQTTGTHYWLQISEIDDVSVNPGAEDFRWSSHRPIGNCAAIQRNAGGVFTQPISDDCVPPVQTDLAFALGSGCVVVAVPLPPPVLALPPVLMVGLSPVGNPEPLVTECVVPSENGIMFLDPELPDGNYDLHVSGMGIRPLLDSNMMIQNGVGQSSFFDVFVGDLNYDGHINGMDIPHMVDGLLNAPP
ncbi:MAG: hypothetical protein U1A27_03820 [Phycisphaerae bacterium]